MKGVTLPTVSATTPAYQSAPSPGEPTPSSTCNGSLSPSLPIINVLAQSLHLQKTFRRPSVAPTRLRDTAGTAAEVADAQTTPAMADPNGPYDPYISREEQGGTGRPAGPDKSRTEELHRTVKATVGKLNENITKLSERGERLDSLQDKTDNLAVNAHGFRRGANRVRKQMWWKDMKMRICIIVGIIILLLVIIIPSVVASKHH